MNEMTKDELLKIHTDRLLGALTAQNYAALEPLYSDDYMLRPDGSVLKRQEVLQDLRTNGLTFHSIDLLQSLVRIYGSTAVVTGKSRRVTSRMARRIAHTFDSSPYTHETEKRSGSLTFKVPLSLSKPAVSLSRNIGDIVMEKISGNALLDWDVFVTPGLPIVARDLPRGVRDANFQAMASTLIYGKRDAVLVDTFMTVKQANALADWIAAKGKNLTTIYITHGHGDHWFGTGTLLKRFPNASAVATPNVVKYMRQRSSPEVLNIWKTAFPNQIPDRLIIAEELKGNAIDLEGHELIAVELGHTDTEYTTCLNVPSIGLVVAGDAAYNDVHLYLAESNAQTRRKWISALDKIESLNPRAVVATHKRPENDDNPRIIEETRQYIRDFDRLAGTTTTAQELYDKMLELYPSRVNPGWALWSSARAVKS